MSNERLPYRETWMTTRDYRMRHGSNPFTTSSQSIGVDLTERSVEECALRHKVNDFDRFPVVTDEFAFGVTIRTHGKGA